MSYVVRVQLINEDERYREVEPERPAVLEPVDLGGRP